MDPITSKNKNGLTQRQIDLVKTARANMIGLISGPDALNIKTMAWKEVNDIAEEMEKLLGY